MTRFGFVSRISSRLFPETAVLMFLVFVAASPAPSQTLAPQTPRGGQVVDELRNQSDVLRGQLEVMKQYDQRLLSTVYWALGTIVTLVGILVGFGWFANFRMHERDKNALATELRGLIVQEITERGGALDAKFADLRREGEKAFAEASTRLTSLVEDIRQHVNARTDAIGQDVGRSAEAIREAASQMVKTEAARRESRLQSLDSRMVAAEFDLCRIEARRWQAEDVMANVLTTHSKMLELAVKHSSLHWHIGSVLDEIRGTLENLLRAGRGKLIDADHIGALNGLLDKADSEHVVSIGTLKALLGRLHAS